MRTLAANKGLGERRCSEHLVWCISMVAIGFVLLMFTSPLVARYTWPQPLLWPVVFAQRRTVLHPVFYAGNSSMLLLDNFLDRLYRAVATALL